MNLHDPSRPRLANGALQYLDRNGRVLGVVPSWIVNIDYSGSAHIKIMLADAPREYTWYELRCPFGELPGLALAWENDPEVTMETQFSRTVGDRMIPYSRPNALAPAPRPTVNVTLEDLGL